MNDLNPFNSICLMRIEPPPHHRLPAGPPAVRVFYPCTSSVFQYAASTALRKGSHSL
jgi:hypothetical protein